MRRTRSAFRIGYHLPALAACALVAVVAWVAMTPAPVEPTYALLGFEADGNVYILDYGMSLSDCRAREYDVRHGYTVCEAEG